jgi:hypothetical protein
MNYTQPEVAVLGQAVHVIENLARKPIASVTDSLTGRHTNPAYDLDE